MKYFIFLLVSLFCLNAYCQFSTPDLSDWQTLTDSFHGLKGLSLFSIAFLISQTLFNLFRTQLGNLLGIYKLIILSTLSLSVTIGAKIAAGEHLLTALFDGPTLLAYQVLAHQAYKQWGKRDEDRKNNSDSSSDSCDSLSDSEQA